MLVHTCERLLIFLHLFFELFLKTPPYQNTCKTLVQVVVPFSQVVRSVSGDHGALEPDFTGREKGAV